MSFETISSEFGSNVKIINNLDALVAEGTLVGNDLTLPGCSYAFSEPVTIPYTWIVTGATRVMDLSEGANTITFTGTNAFKSTSLSRLQITSSSVSMASGVQLFDLTGSGYSVSITECLFLGGELGIIEGSGLLAWSEMSYAGFTGGLTVRGGTVVSFAPVNFVPGTFTTPGSTLSFDGTFNRAINVLGAIVDADGAGNSCLNFDSGMTVRTIKVRGNDLNFTNGATFLASGSLDRTDPRANFRSNSNEPDSAAFGEFFMNGNAVETVIAAQDTPVKVAGTTTGGNNERFDIENGKLIYRGLEDVVARVMVFGRITVNANNEGDQYSIYIFKTGVLQPNTQDTLVLGDALNAPNSLAIPNCLIPLSTDDELEVFVENNTASNENILFNSLQMAAFV